jgi:hypothetical protein
VKRAVRQLRRNKDKYTGREALKLQMWMKFIHGASFYGPSIAAQTLKIRK